MIMVSLHDMEFSEASFLIFLHGDFNHVFCDLNIEIVIGLWMSNIIARLHMTIIFC